MRSDIHRKQTLSTMIRAKHWRKVDDVEYKKKSRNKLSLSNAGVEESHKAQRDNQEEKQMTTIIQTDSDKRQGEETISIACNGIDIRSRM